MTVLAQIQKDLHALQVLVARLEERIEPKKGSHGLRNTLVSVFGGAFLLWIAWVSVSVASLNGRLANGGTAKIVEQLRSPSSPQQLQANLSSVIAQVQTARVSKAPLTPAKITTLSHAVADVIQRVPSSQEGWQAAAELISYKSNPANTQDTLVACPEGEGHGKMTPQSSADVMSGKPLLAVEVSLLIHDCTLVLDRDPQLRRFISMKEGSPVNPQMILRLDNVHVIYSGGLIAPFDVIVFRNCTFSFAIPDPPSNNARQLTATLLASNKLNDVTVHLPNA